MMEDPSLQLAVVTTLALVGGLVLERLLLTRWRWSPYFAAGLPLMPGPVAIPSRPSGEGKTASVRWEVVGDLVRFWAEPGDRAAPSGLHGAIRLYDSGGRTGLAVRWSPPWSYLLAAVWLVVLGLMRGEIELTLPIATMLVIGIFVAYQRFAARAVQELRATFVTTGS